MLMVWNRKIPPGTEDPSLAEDIANGSDIIIAIISTSCIFMLLIAIGFAYRAKTAKHIEDTYHARVLDSSVPLSDIHTVHATKSNQNHDIHQIKPSSKKNNDESGGEQETYWVFNRDPITDDVEVHY